MQVLFSVVQQKWEPARLLFYFNRLPEAIRKKLARLQQWQDLQLSLCGYLLLQKALQRVAGYQLSLHDIQWNKWNKPFFKEPLQFNISHSGEYVVCAIDYHQNVGIDIEKIIPVQYAEFRCCWTEREWRNLQLEEGGADLFFSYWTKKEAVVKAIGEGLNIPLQEIDLYADTASTSTHGTWHLKELTIHPRYKMHLATQVRIDNSIIPEQFFF